MNLELERTHKSWINQVKKILIAKLGYSYRDLLPIKWDDFSPFDTGPEEAARKIMEGR